MNTTLVVSVLPLISKAIRAMALSVRVKTLLAVVP
jgi:hypothetical protein